MNVPLEKNLCIWRCVVEELLNTRTNDPDNVRNIILTINRLGIAVECVGRTLLGAHPSLLMYWKTLPCGAIYGNELSYGSGVIYDNCGYRKYYSIDGGAPDLRYHPVATRDLRIYPATARLFIVRDRKYNCLDPYDDGKFAFQIIYHIWRQGPDVMAAADREYERTRRISEYFTFVYQDPETA